MITFVLMEPEVAGNVGAVARVMKNFGFDRLVIINPKCNIHSLEAEGRSKHAWDVLRGARIAKPSILKTFHTVIATTSQLGTDYNIPRTPITPAQLADILPNGAFLSKHASPKKGSSKKNQAVTGEPDIAILFGREGIGLTNQEILASDFIVTIPAQKKYPTLNLSHSVAIVAYELSIHRKTKKVSSHIPLASSEEKKQLMNLLDEVLDQLEFSTSFKKDTQRRVWKRLFSKSFMSRREAFAAMGLFRLLLRQVKK